MSSSFWMKDGKILANGAGAVVFDDHCCCDSVPCTCPDGLSACYKLPGYIDGDITLCEICDTTGSGTAWDGTFSDYLEPGTCQWTNTGLIDVVDGVGHNLTAILRLINDGGVCKWVLWLSCYSSATMWTEMWTGVKTTGTTPIGVYTRISGCTGPSALAVGPC